MTNTVFINVGLWALFLILDAIVSIVVGNYVTKKVWPQQ